MTDELVKLLVVAGLAAVPWIEILFVIPLGLVMGLPPWLVFASALGGNLATIVLMIAAYDRLEPWLRRRLNRHHNGAPTARQARFRRYWDRYGLPGVALTSPLITGTHLGAALMLLTGADRRRTTAWMTAALVLWSAALTVLVHMGLDVTGLRRPL
jgi:uncharacterized membrane protein